MLNKVITLLIIRNGGCWHARDIHSVILNDRFLEGVVHILAFNEYCRPGSVVQDYKSYGKDCDIADIAETRFRMIELGNCQLKAVVSEIKLCNTCLGKYRPIRDIQICSKVLMEAAVLGMGITLPPRFLFQQALEDGELQIVFCQLYTYTVWTLRS